MLYAEIVNSFVSEKNETGQSTVIYDGFTLIREKLKDFSLYFAAQNKLIIDKNWWYFRGSMIFQ